MKALLILLFVLGMCRNVDAQEDFDSIAFDRANEMYFKMGVNLSIQDKDGMRIFDSLLKFGYVQVMAEYLKNVLAEDGYNWPYWWYVARNYDSVFYPDPNYQTLLHEKYNIGMYYLRNGCRFHSSYLVYDSLMRDAILKKYGTDFFERSRKEAEQLVKNGEGLTLPYVATKEKTIKIIKEIRAKDTVKEQYRFLVISFAGDTVKSAYRGHLGPPGSAFVQFWGAADPTYYDDNDLTRLVRRYKWTGPRFRKKGIVHRVYFDFEQQTLEFMDGR